MFSESRMASVRHPCHRGCPNDTRRIGPTRLTTSYLLTLHAVAGCATGSTRPKRCPRAGRASWPLPSFPRNRQYKTMDGCMQPPYHPPGHLGPIQPPTESSALSVRLQSKPPRSAVPRMPAGLLPCRFAQATRKNSAPPGPTAPFATNASASAKVGCLSWYQAAWGCGKALTSNNRACRQTRSEKLTHRGPEPVPS
jgi:hypothetical protein